MSRTLLVAGLSIGLAFAASSHAQSNPPPPAASAGGVKQQEQAAVGDRRADETKSIATPATPLVVNVSPTQTVECKPERPAEAEHHETFAEKLTAWATVGLACITLGLTIFTAFLWRSTRNLVRETTKGARAIERAYVFGGMKLIGALTPVGPRPERNFAEVTFRNFGKTPAEIDKIDIYHVQVATFPHNDNEYIPWARPVPLPPGRAIAPGGKYIWRHKFNINQYRDTIEIVALIEYRDVFDKKRTTSFVWKTQQPAFDAPSLVYVAESPLNERT